MIFQTSKSGYDISTWQDAPDIAGSVDFVKMRDSGASFVIMRASIGNQVDVDFPTYKVNSRGILPRGVYHYYWNNIDPKIQAQTCLAAIGSEKLEGRVWLDLETREAGLYRGAAHWKIFIDTIQAVGLRVGIYTGHYWWRDEAVNKGANLSFFAQFPLWQAWYTTNPADVLVAQGWKDMMLWQDTSLYNGSSAGVESTAIDHDKWNDAYNFETEWGTVTPPPIGDVTMNGTAKENGGRIGKIRTTPSRYGTQTGTSPAYATIEFVSIANSIDTGIYAADKWFLLPDGRYLNYIISGQEYFTILTQPTTEPPPVEPPPAVSPVIHASMDFDLTAKTMVTTRRRADGTSDINRDPIA